ncbi:MFS transporter [Chloroflexota bacterium]
MTAIKNYSPPSKRPKVFYGYWILVTTFFCLFIFSGCGFYAFSLFVRPLQADFGWGRGGIMTALTIYLLVVGLSSPFVGRVIDRYGAGKIISAGAFAVGIGFTLLSLMNNLWQFYGGYIIVGVGMAAIGVVPATTVVSNWFKKRRGTAVGIVSAGIGAGGFTLSPFIGGYLIPNFSWRASYLTLAVLSWVLIIPLALLVVKTKPADMGLYPDGRRDAEAVNEAKTSLSASEGLTLKMTIATSGFWLIAVSFLTGGFGQAGTFQSQAPYLEDIGFPAAMSAGVLGSVGLFSLIGKFSFGWLCDRIPAKYAWFIGLVFLVFSTIVLMSTKPASHPAIVWLYAIAMGLGTGSWAPTMSMLISTNFGLVAYGTIFGVVTLFHSLGVATGPLTAGYIYDTVGSYHWAFIIFLALDAIAIPAILMVRRPK